jgi:HK97 family phage prohead protease
MSVESRYSDDQPRDKDGKFGSGGGGGEPAADAKWKEGVDPTDKQITYAAPQIVDDFKQDEKENAQEDGRTPEYDGASLYDYIKMTYRPYMSETGFDKLSTAVDKAAKEKGLRYSEDQPREKDGKFGSGGGNGGFQPLPGKGPDMPGYDKYVAYVESGEPNGTMSYKEWFKSSGEAEAHPSGLDAKGVATLQEHLLEAVKEDNHVWAHALGKSISGDKFSKADKEAFIEHYQDATKEGEHDLAATFWAAFHRSDPSQDSSNREGTMSKSIETRYATELRVAPGDEMVLQGYAATFNSLSKDLGGFREMIAPGAFTRALAEKQDVRCLFNHSADKVLGRTAAGTLVLAQDEKGLSFRCQLDPKQTAHRDLHASVARGDINECSFAFSPNGDSGDVWENRKDSDGSWYIARTLKDVNLFDVSAVTHPAYNGTNVAARAEVVPVEIRSIISKLIEKRAKAEKRDSDDSLEDYIREVGKALAVKFPREGTDATAPAYCGYGKYWICETYPDYIIANDESQMDGYVRIPYVEDGDDNYVFGTPVPVEKEWVPSERCAKVATENRSVVAEHLKAIAAAHAGTAGDHQGAAAAHTDAADTHAAAAAAISAAADKQDKEDKKAAKAAKEAEEAAAAAKAAEQRDEEDDENEEDPDPDDPDGERSAAPVVPMTPEEIEEMDLRFRLSIAAPDANPGLRYSDDQPRDKDGKFGSGGSGSSKEKTVADLASKHLGIESFTVKNNDSADFKEVYQPNAGKALNEAYEAGQKAPTEAPKDGGFVANVKGDAQAQYEKLSKQIAEHIDSIKSGLAAHAGQSDKHWGHVGDLQHHASQLKDISDALNHTGEYKRSEPFTDAEVRYSDDQPRDDHGRWGGGDSIGKTSSGKDIPAANHKVYNEAQKMPKYNGKVSPANAHGRDGGKMLKQRLEGWSKQDHMEASQAHTAAAAAQEKTWSAEADKAAQETFGRPYKAVEDYKISGIASDKFSEASKDKLREAAHTATDHKEAALAHWHAAGKHGRP